MAQHYQHSPDRIIEIPNDPTPPDTTIIHLPPGQLYHRYPSTSAGSSFPMAGGGGKASKFRSILCWAIFVLVVIVLSFLIFVFVLYIALKPKAPKFSIRDFTDEYSGGVGGFKLRLSAYNPNAHMGLFIKHDGGGFADLSLNDREIARGRPPDVYLAKRNTTRFEVWLEGSRDGARWVWEEEEEMRFEMDVKVRLKLWLVKAWDMKMDVKCRFRASRQVSNGTHVVSQTCRDKIKF
uniref:Late embryogenesis abundant protein LEA-2 subgroup domain-containing protein n=1 Tax=Kalanchoe fedtschenkoi TaxID=63787 RepID=A0A7N1A6N8_KALFE